MKRLTYYKFYIVRWPRTQIVTVSVNDFRRVKGPARNGKYQLLPENERFYGYTNWERAMESAKKVRLTLSLCIKLECLYNILAESNCCSKLLDKVISFDMKIDK